jgi:hypothetical protein
MRIFATWIRRCAGKSQRVLSQKPMNFIIEKLGLIITENLKLLDFFYVPSASRSRISVSVL